MKKHFLLVALFFSFFTKLTFSQVIIDSTDLPAKGELYKYGNVVSTLGNYSIGDSGASVLWDFSVVTEDFIDSTLFLEPLATPYSASFPTADLVMKKGTDPYLYLKTGSSQFSVIGEGLNFPGAVPFYDPLTFLQLPLSYHSGYSDGYAYDSKFLASGIPFTDSIRAVGKSSSVNYVDAYGKVTLPTGIYDCIRHKIYTVSFDTTYAHNTFSQSWLIFQIKADTIYEYYWWCKEINSRLVYAKIDKAGLLTELNYYNGSDSVANNPPISKFTFAPFGLKVYFFDNSLNIPTTWHWDFGNGDTSNVKNPVHDFDSAKSYIVCLTVKNLYGVDTSCLAVDLTTVNTSENNNPDLNISIYNNGNNTLILDNPTSKETTFSIYLLNGSKAFSGKISSYSKTRINLSDRITPGFYLLKVEDVERRNTFKVIKY